MSRITEELIRKRAEHNDGEIFSLEELSLHQQDIEKIEYLDKWCRELKILYLQSNLIEKIENVGRLKKLEYLNLALNNIERIENLEACESLKKLDLTVNFVGELTSIDSLRSNFFLEEIYLTGNPCVNFEGYRDYVIAALPQLQRLDGKEISKAERIQACQKFELVRKEIKKQECEYKKKREAEKRKGEEEIEKDSASTEPSNKTSDENKNKDFWNTKSDYTPESRKQIQQKMRENVEKNTKSCFEKPEMKRQRRYFNDDGDPMNMNEAKIDFTLVETDDDSAFTLDVACYKFLDTSLIDVDVQPKYVRVTLKGKVLQLVLTEEVSPDKCTAQRSQTTGHLLLTMPKLNPPPKPTREKKGLQTLQKVSKENKNISSDQNREKLEYNSSNSFVTTLSTIAKDAPKQKTNKKQPEATTQKDKEIEYLNSDDFIDDPDVPPLI